MLFILFVLFYFMVPWLLPFVGELNFL